MVLIVESENWVLKPHVKCIKGLRKRKSHENKSSFLKYIGPSEAKMYVSSISIACRNSLLDWPSIKRVRILIDIK